MSEWRTRREKIIRLLTESREPLTIDEIAAMIGEDDRRKIIEDLEHIAKTVRKEGKQLLMEPARCNKCGYVFRSARIRPPSRCPRCKSEWIQPPRFTIR
ncbi:MAG: transcriptional regulator [Euryarchaeota archaeon]